MENLKTVESVQKEINRRAEIKLDNAMDKTLRSINGSYECLDILKSFNNIEVNVNGKTCYLSNELSSSYRDFMQAIKREKLPQFIERETALFLLERNRLDITNKNLKAENERLKKWKEDHTKVRKPSVFKRFANWIKNFRLITINCECHE